MYKNKKTSDKKLRIKENDYKFKNYSKRTE